jgi:hypothetical protein
MIPKFMRIDSSVENQKYGFDIDLLTGLKEIGISLSTDLVLCEVAAGCSATLWSGRPICILHSLKSDVPP